MSPGIETAVRRPRVRAAAVAPEPVHCWVRWVPRRWPAPAGRWLDLARGGLGAPAREATEGVPEIAGGPFEDLLYLPPVEPALAASRDALAAAHLERGTPVLCQARPGDPSPAAGTVVWDLLEPLLAGDPAALSTLPAGALTVWPLLPGLTDGPGLIDEGLARLAVAGARVVQPLVPRLTPADRRRLAEELAGVAELGEGATRPADEPPDETPRPGSDGRSGDPSERLFERLFHGPESDERGFARAAAVRGLEIFLPRPLPRPPLAGAANRRLAGYLYLAGELWLRLGRPPSQGQAFFRAARWLDDSGYDPQALARDGHLAVVAAIDAASRTLIEHAVAGAGEPELLRELRARYLLDDEAAGAAAGATDRSEERG